MNNGGSLGLQVTLGNCGMAVVDSCELCVGLGALDN